MRKAAIILIVITLMAVLAYYATGTRLSGAATNAIEIPCVGNDLSELVLSVPASYHGFEHPHGGGTLTVSGTATHESVSDFCQRADVTRSLDGTAILDRDGILNQLRSFEAFGPDASVNDSAYVLFGMAGRFPKLYGTYDASTQQFLIWLQFEGSK